MKIVEQKKQNNCPRVELLRIVQAHGVGSTGLPKKDWVKDGSFPVIGQGENYIEGWTNREDLVIKPKSGLVLYGGHTRRTKYIEKPFVPGPNAKILAPYSMLKSKYLFYFLKQVYIRDRGYADHFPEVRKALIPVPSLKEQDRIIAKLEELLSELDVAIAEIKKVQEQIETYRQAVLKSAFEGKFTKKWREKHSESNTVSNLLARIREERLRKSKKLESYYKKIYSKEISNGETSNWLAIPSKWIFVRIGELCDFLTKGTTPKADDLHGGKGEIPFIKVYNLTFSGLLDFSVNPTFVDRKTHDGFLARSKVYPNDILMNIVGPPLGKVSLVPGDHPEWNINQAIAIFRPLPGLVTKYIMYFLLSQSSVRAMMKKSKATAGQFNLTLEICRDALIPFCSHEEQEQIVLEIEQRLSVADSIDGAIKTNFKKSEALRQSILKKAFEGGLVKQDPKDESAEELLERIKEEKVKIETEMKKARKKLKLKI